MFKFLPRFAFLTFILASVNYVSYAQVSLTATAGNPAGTYTTLKASFDSINSGYHKGIITISLTANTTETASAVLNASGSGAALYTSVFISPTVPVIITGNFAGGVIKLNGADHVTIDGRIAGVGQNITIANSSTAAATAAVWISSTGAGAGATHNIIRNCNLSCGVTQNTATTATYAVAITGTAVTTTSAGADNDSNQVVENNITRARYGVLTRGESATNLNEGTIINNNIIGPASGGPNQIGKVGIFAQFENNCEISYNTIQFVGGVFANTSAGADRVAIAIGSESWGTTVTAQVNTNFKIHHNVIHDIVDERTFTAAGILHAGSNGGLPTNHMIYNNFLYNIHSNGTSGDQGLGIGIAAGANDIIAYNSISMTEGDIDPAGTTTASQSNVGIRILSSTPVDLTLKNNIINVDLSSNTATLNHYAIVAPSGAYPWGTGGLNNNNYFINAANPQMKIGGTGTTVPFTPFATFAAWKTNFGATQDLNSQNVNPNFVSPTNLHIVPAVVSNLESKATPIVGINTDIDNDVRPGPAGSVNGGALAPDIGADEFDGIPLLLDVGISALLSPTTSGCHSATDSVKVRLTNYSIQAINFATDSVTVNASVSGTNPMVFTPVVINSGTLAPLATLDIMMAPVYNMSALGTYTFNANATVAGDGNNSNNSIPPVIITISGGTASASVSATCHLDPVTLTVSGYTNGGTVQWQYFSTATASWINYPGASNINPFTTLLTDTTAHFRALICGTYPSTNDSVDVTTVDQPIAADVTRCGPGQVTLTATGTNLTWYDVPTGGTPIDTGTTFNVFAPVSTAYYVQSSTGGSNENVSSPTVGASTFHTNSTGWGLRFTVNNPLTIQTVKMYPANTTAGPASLQVRVTDLSDVTLYSGPVYNFTSSTSNTEHTIPVNISLPPGNYKMVMTSTGINSLIRESTGVSFPYSNPSNDVNVTAGANGTGTSQTTSSYYWFYSWVISTGCVSTRDTVHVTVTPSDTITASIVTNPICSYESTAINVTSVNGNYQYTWTPPDGLSSTTGPSVTTTNDTTITYTINAFDPGTTCEAYTYATVTVFQAPQITITTPDTALCEDATLQIDGNSNSHITFSGDVGTGTSINTPTSTTILGPYGGLYGGARHQYLVLGTELQAAGLTAGLISQVAFDVTALNSVAPLADYVVKIDTTSLNVLTTSFAPVNNLVYYNPSFMPSLGWNPHTFSNNFMWDGVSNIIVEVCFNNVNAGTASGNASVHYTSTTGTNTVNYYRADNDPNVCGMLSGTPAVTRPNMRFSTVAPVSYQWSPITGLSDDTIINPLLTAISTNTYTLTVTDDVNGCIATDNITVSVNNPPVFTIGNDTSVCSNLAVTPFAIYGSDINLNYVWFDNTTSSGTVVNSPGTYWATGTDNNGCSSSDTMVVNTVDPADVDINIDVTSTNTADLDAGAGYSSYLWSTSLTTQVVTVTGNGTYWVQVTDANGCPNADTVSIIFSLGIDETADGQLLFYPNPSTGMINMAGTGLNGEPLKVEILDISGQIIYQQNIQEPGENFIEILDLSMVAEGTYLVRVTNKHKTYASRIIIVRK